MSAKRILRRYDNIAVFEPTSKNASNFLFAERDEDARNSNNDLPCTISIVTQSQIPQNIITNSYYESVQFEAIFGFYHWNSGTYIALISDSETWVDEKISNQKYSIRKATKIHVIPLFLKQKSLSGQKKDDEMRYLQLLDQGFKENAFFFSHESDITLTQQQLAKLNLSASNKTGIPLWKRANPHYFWNRYICTLLVTITLRSIVPMMMMMMMMMVVVMMKSILTSASPLCFLLFLFIYSSP